VKAKDKNAKPDANKQKKQLLMLGGLVVMLGIVIAVQFGGSEPEATAEALAPPPDPAAIAQELATDPAAAAAALGEEAPAAPAASSPASVASGSSVADNPVLSEPVAGEAEGEGLLRSPFANFWSVATPAATTGEVVEIAPPSIILNATLPSAHRALAVIDGEMHFVGDVVQGWEVAEVLERRIVLRSPSQATVTIEMPILVGPRALPAALASPAAQAAPVPTDG